MSVPVARSAPAVAGPHANGAPPARVDVVRIDASGRSAWDEFVAATPGASIYHRYAWRDLIESVFRRETHYLAAIESGQVRGVLPLVRLRSLLFGDFLVSMPYLNYGGILSAEDSRARALLDAAISLARELGVSHIELRHRRNAFAELPVRTDKVTMLLPLPSDPEVLWKGLTTKQRTKIRRPQKDGAECTIGGVELLDDFYRVFAENMRDLGTPVYPARFFRAILERFPAEARLFSVKLRGAPVCGGFVIRDGETLEIPWASSLRSANALSVNMFMYWRVLEFACTSGARVFDFGRSTVDSGTYNFKQQWGAVPEQLYWHYWMRDGGAPAQINHANPKYQAAIAAWQKLPLAVANRLGPWLVRNLP